MVGRVVSFCLKISIFLSRNNICNRAVSRALVAFVVAFCVEV